MHRKLDAAFEERLCIPRMEEKVGREARALLREQDILMRQREMMWSQ